MDNRIKVALFLAKSPVHGLLQRTHRKLSRYIDLADNWNNGDERTNGEAFLIRMIAPKLRVVFDIGASETMVKTRPIARFSDGVVRSPNSGNQISGRARIDAAGQVDNDERADSATSKVTRAFRVVAIIMEWRHRVDKRSRDLNPDCAAARHDSLDCRDIIESVKAGDTTRTTFGERRNSQFEKILPHRRVAEKAAGADPHIGRRFLQASRADLDPLSTVKVGKLLGATLVEFLAIVLVMIPNRLKKRPDGTLQKRPSAMRLSPIEKMALLLPLAAVAIAAYQSQYFESGRIGWLFGAGSRGGWFGSSADPPPDVVSVPLLDLSVSITLSIVAVVVIACSILAVLLVRPWVTIAEWLRQVRVRRGA
jgi:hypothetical protein